MSLDVFFDALKQGNRNCEMLWDSYLEHLAVGIANLRAIFDCKIVLGGKISPYLAEHIHKLSQKILKHSIYEHDASFVILGKYRQEVFAVGAAKMLLDQDLTLQLPNALKTGQSRPYLHDMSGDYVQAIPM